VAVNPPKGPIFEPLNDCAARGHGVSPGLVGSRQPHRYNSAQIEIVNVKYENILRKIELTISEPVIYYFT
jgi:hypothetical protein